MMRRFVLTIAAASAALTAAAALPSGASAALLAPRLSIDSAAPVENVALCFYLDGWAGPGLYDCGFRWRRGRGYHGRHEEYRRRYEGRDEFRGRYERREEFRGRERGRMEDNRGRGGERQEGSSGASGGWRPMGR